MCAAILGSSSRLRSAPRETRPGATPEGSSRHPAVLTLLSGAASIAVLALRRPIACPRGPGRGGLVKNEEDRARLSVPMLVSRIGGPSGNHGVLAGARDDCSLGRPRRSRRRQVLSCGAWRIWKLKCRSASCWSGLWRELHVLTEAIVLKGLEDDDSWIVLEEDRRHLPERVGPHLSLLLIHPGY